jgi:ABC-type transport system substrate-binding protein
LAFFCRINVKGSSLSAWRYQIMAFGDSFNGAAMRTKFIALLFAGATLSGCCASGIGCTTQMAGTPTSTAATSTAPTSAAPTSTAAAPIAWDGLGEAPAANDEQAEEKRPPKRKTVRNREISAAPHSDAPPRSDARAQYDAWTRLPNEDPEADAKLKRQLKICRDC